MIYEPYDSDTSGDERKHQCSEKQSYTDGRAELILVERYMKKNHGKVKGTNCYDQRNALGLFHRYGSHLTLKMTFHRKAF
jgi:hypothetical protein